MGRVRWRLTRSGNGLELDHDIVPSSSSSAWVAGSSLLIEETFLRGRSASADRPSGVSLIFSRQGASTSSERVIPLGPDFSTRGRRLG